MEEQGRRRRGYKDKLQFFVSIHLLVNHAIFADTRDCLRLEGLLDREI